MSYEESNKTDQDKDDLIRQRCYFFDKEFEEFVELSKSIILRASDDDNSLADQKEHTKKLNNYAHKDEPAVVDIYPTIARFMHVSIPTSLQYELDGVPLIGAVSVAKPSVVLKSNSLQLQWQALEDSGTVKIYAATTNQFKTGGTDHYTLIATVPNQQQSFEMPLPKEQTAVLKLVIQGAHNCVNTWYTASNTTSAK